MENINDKESCQEECQKISQCNFWTYDPATKKCYPRSEKSEEKTRLRVNQCNNCKRGPKVCKGHIKILETHDIARFFADDTLAPKNGSTGITASGSDPIQCVTQCRSNGGCKVRISKKLENLISIRLPSLVQGTISGHRKVGRFFH